VIADHSPNSSRGPAELDPQYKARRNRASDTALKSDRVFTTSGRGHGGSITEYRRGIKAHIGLDIDYGSAIRQLSMFPADPEQNDSYLLLLTLPDSTDVLELSPDLQEAKALDRSGSPFDYSSRTLSTHSPTGTMFCQVTETSIMIFEPSSRYNSLPCIFLSLPFVVIIRALLMALALDVVSTRFLGSLGQHVRTLREGGSLSQ
jgi:hypothetical protein